MSKHVAPPDALPLRAIVIAGTHSGVGKTSVTLGLIGALRRLGFTVQPFKVGPDFIDGLHHHNASGRASRNLDGWMLSAQTNVECFARATADADVAVIEGVMGLFDGSEGTTDRGSTAEMAKLLGLSVVLVVDASAMARSAAAVIHGFVSFDPELQVCGVILNNVGGRAHADMIRDAVGGAVPIFGAIPHATDLVVAERHLGLFLPHEIRSGHLDELADLIEKHVDLDLLLNKSVTDRRPVPAVPEPLPLAVRIGVARDEAFCFYYTDNLELLERAGAKLVEFSPLNDPIPDDLDGLYIGGGYPELHADKLAANTATLKAVREFAEAGGPIYAECGGLMYLARNLHIDGTTYPLCGVLPFDTKMPATLKIAYVEVNTAGGLFGVGHVARGHMFHASEIAGELTEPNGYHVETSRGEHIDEGYSVGNVLASYAHLHFASQPALASAFVSRCLEFRASANASRGSSTASVI